MATNKHYKNILIAIDFSESAKHVITRALEVADADDTKLTLIHVVEYYPLIGIGADMPTSYNWDIPQEDLLKGAEISLDNFIKEYSLVKINKIVSFGPTHTEIVSHAKKDKNDLIIIGSHGRHGVGLLLGSTANGVLHHAECDV
ncbi:MAG: universal stress protein, partial [Gammaproteobacteria bacterium]